MVWRKISGVKSKHSSRGRPHPEDGAIYNRHSSDGVGVRDYSIFYDEETKTLFASQNLTAENTAESLAMNEVVRKWWDYMNDGIMEYNEKDEPVAVPLREVFHMD